LSARIADSLARKALSNAIAGLYFAPGSHDSA